MAVPFNSPAQAEVLALRASMSGLRTSIERGAAAPAYLRPASGADLLRLAEAFCGHTGLAKATLSNRITTTHARLFSRTENNAGCTVRTYRNAVSWFSANWPADLAWPADIPRPAPEKET